MFFQRERNTGLSFSNFFGQSEKISAKENCLYGIIDTRITSFLDCGFLGFRQLYYVISSEELFVFEQQKMLYLCRFAKV